MKILITGGAGFIGSHLTEKFLEQGHKVCVIDNYQTGRKDNLKIHCNLQIIEGSIYDNVLVNKVFAEFKPEKVIHAAASYKDPENWMEDSMTNVIGTINIVKASKEHNVSRLIYFQTALCYGLTPIEQPITLNHPLYAGAYSGGSSYAISKTAGEQYIELSGLDFISFRLANIIGPRNLSGPIATFYNRITTNKAVFVMDTRRDFVFVNDLVTVVTKAINGEGYKGYYHVSTGKDYSIKEVLEATLKALNMKLDKEIEVKPRSANDVFSILIDPSKTNADFKWVASTPLQTATDKAVEWYKTYGIAQAYTHLTINKD